MSLFALNCHGSDRSLEGNLIINHDFFWRYSRVMIKILL